MGQEPSAEELLRRIQELEVLHAHIKQQISSSKLMQISSSSSSVVYSPAAKQQPIIKPDHYYLNIIQSMGQAVHVFDRQYRILFWNRLAEEIYGLSAAEVFGKTPADEILVDPKDATLADYLLERTVNGETWSGEFPIRNKRGETFAILCTNTPFRDENGRLIGGICMFTESRHYNRSPSINIYNDFNFVETSNLAASKVTSDDDDGDQGELAISPRGHIGPSPFGAVYSKAEVEILCPPKAVAAADDQYWMKGTEKTSASVLMSPWKWNWKWKWKGNDHDDDSSLAAQLFRFGWQRLHVVNQEQQQQQQKSRRLTWENNNYMQQEPATGLCLQSRRGEVEPKPKTDILHSLDYEIIWDHLITKRLIGQGSCGTVYHGTWHGSDVAIKRFTYQEFSVDTMVLFKQEVSLMKRLRHPNILLFMGAVTCSPECLSIVTEFLPRGSLFQILQQKSTRLDCRRRLQMAIDIARGMNYLHRYNPPIVHRDLKSSNLLVDKNWVVKVGDFGLSRIKHQTYLNTKSGKGTPQWMAPEVFRNEQADEKSDTYSYGVVLWEIITRRIPWDDLNPMQVIAAVGFMDRRLEIPKDVDPLWTSLIQSCWCSEPQSRPTFQEILYKLKDMQKKYAAERRK